MGILLVLFLIAIVSFILVKIFEYSWSECLFMLIGILSAFVFIVMTPIAIVENACANKTYADLVEKREVIEYRLEEIGNDKNLLVNGGTYEDLLAYNKTIRAYKTYAHNFWNGWFYADKIAELDYIELPEGT